MQQTRLIHVSGFTLVELVITLIILSILATTAYIQWPGATLTLSSAANKLAADLRYTQSLSMSANQRYRLVKTSANTYQIVNSSGTAVILPSGASAVSLGSNIAFSSLTNIPNNLIAFDGRGVPYTDTGPPGTALATTAVFTLSGGGETMTVSITPQTGRVTVP